MTGIIRTKSRTLRHGEGIAPRAGGEKQSHSKNGFLVFLLAMGLILGLPACSGGGFNGNNGGGLVALASTITSTTNTVLSTAETVVTVIFEVSGEPGQAFTFQLTYDTTPGGVPVLAEGVALVMTEIGPVQLGDPALPPGYTLQGNPITANIPADGTNFQGAFVWEAGTDLGFFSTDYNATVQITAGNLAGQAVISGGTATLQNFTAVNVSQISQGSAGAGGNVGGRSDHSAHLVSDTNPATATLDDIGTEILVVGGQDDAGLSLNNIDRFSVNVEARTNSVPNPQLSNQVRREHASATYLSTGGGTDIHVLVSGGNVAGVATNTADVYRFGPSPAPNVVVEGVTPTNGVMNSARRRHAACWLPDNNILITAGIDATGTTIASAELYDTNTGLFLPLVTPPTFPARKDHTHCLLPDGTVLIAGGSDNGGDIVDAWLYDVKSQTFSNTGVVIDRVGHTATLLVNGICALTGGRTIGGTVSKNTVDFYRPHAGMDTTTGAGTPTPAGFTTAFLGANSATPAVANLNNARANHATSRLGDSSLLLTGGFNVNNATLGTSELFIPSKFTDVSIGLFSIYNPGLDPFFDLKSDRARHTQTTAADGSAVLVGGVTGTTTTNTALDSIEVFQFQNTPPVATALAVSVVSTANVLITFNLTDAEGDCSFVIVRITTNNGTTWTFPTLLNAEETVNLAPGSHTVRWNALADGLTAQTVQVQVIPFGGAIGTPILSGNIAIP